MEQPNNELLIRIDERVKALHDLIQTTITNHTKDNAELWEEIKLLKLDIATLKALSIQESITIKIRNGLVWIFSAAFVGWLFSHFMK